MEYVKAMLEQSIKEKQQFIGAAKDIHTCANAMISCLEKGNKILVCGNGGSAADSQHIAAELVGRFKRDRKGLPAIALTTDTSILTAWSNDISFEDVFRRQVEAMGNNGDVLLAISTSGNSPNVLSAVEEAKKRGLTVISLTGDTGGKLKSLSDLNINATATDTPRIQECHMLAYHCICELIDEAFAK